MPLNYSKWDAAPLLSDDSDSEADFSVDKKSLIRWKQRDIHEKRKARKHRIKTLTAQIDCNKVLLPRITEIANNIANPLSSTPATVYFANLVEHLRTNPSRDCPPGNDPFKLEHTYDGMLLSLLNMVDEKSKDKVKEAGVPEADKEERLAEELAAEMAVHVKRLSETIEKDQKQLEEEEQKNVNRIKITQPEENKARGQVQLAPLHPSQTISFNVPDGPPPEDLILEEPEAESMDAKEIRKLLQFRWDIFQGFSPEMQEALKFGGLDSINKLLDHMDIADARGMVDRFDAAGILTLAGERNKSGQTILYFS